MQRSRRGHKRREVPSTLWAGAGWSPLHLEMHLSRARQDLLLLLSGSCRGAELQQKLGVGSCLQAQGPALLKEAVPEGAPA